jgi:sortase A
MIRVSDVDESEPTADGPAADDQVPSSRRGKRARRKQEAADAAADGKKGSGRRITFWIGIGLMLAGLGLLGYVAWQFYGTNWVSKRHQREIAHALEQDWASGQGKQPKFIPHGKASALIRIPKFGKKYVIPVLEGVSQDILAKGYGHFEDTSDPGQEGNYAIAAHRVTHGEPLRHMPDLRPGDEVIVETVDTTYTYELDTNPNALVIPFTAVWVLDPLPTNPKEGGPQPAQVQGQRLITLTTCSEIFHTDNRMIAFGHLVKSEAKAPSA